MTKPERLDDFAVAGSSAAEVEILKHLDGDLVIEPRPSTAGEQRAEISGRAKADSLLRDPEAGCLHAVAGAGFEPATFGSRPQIPTTFRRSSGPSTATPHAP